jgi:toxin ParE1/3/4
MSREIILHEEAEYDIIDHAYYLAENSMKTSLRFRKAVRDACEQLAEMPGLGALRDYKNSLLVGLRMWPVPGFQNYLLFYIPREEFVEIVRVLHGAQDIESIFSPEEVDSE